MRGLCPKCAYPRGAGTSQVCTECGMDVTGERMKLHASVTIGLTGMSTSYSLEDSQPINEAELTALLDASSQSQRNGVEPGVACDTSHYTITARGPNRKWTIEFDEISISDKSQDLLRWIGQHCKRD